MRTAVQRRFTVRVFFFLALIITANGVAAQDEATEPSFEGLRDPVALQRLLDREPESIVLVDVRTPREFMTGHIPGAINIPHTEIAENLPTEDTDAVIVLYCRTGVRSSRAQRILEELGYSRIVNFGGVGSWPGDLAQ